ncbi:MAG: YbbR-like domain-containing protein [Pyrinomonadaceae bacterium]
MSFREDDRPQNAAWLARLAPGEWLRKAFVEDWRMKLLALAITLTLWYGVTGLRAPATLRLPGIHLAFRLPNELEIGNNPRDDVEVTLTGSPQALDRVIARDLVAYVDVSDRKPGERVVKLTPESVRIELPEGVRIKAVEPGSVPLRLEPIVQREIEVGAQLEGTVPEGYELRAVTISPSKIRVRGPASLVNTLDKAPTESIQLEGLRETTTIPQVAVGIAEDKIALLDSIVNVRLEIGEERIERSFSNVRVEDRTNGSRRITNASVKLYGARSAINALRAEDVQILLETASGNEPVPPRVVASSGVDMNIEVRSLTSAKYSNAK